MTIKPFDYREPYELNEAISVLSEYGSDAALLAGGTDLLILLKVNAVAPKVVINLKHIPGLIGINSENGKTRIGALTTIRAIEKSIFIQEKFPALGEAAGLLGSIQIRHLATLGGNLCRAAPCAETAPPLIALGACVSIVGPEGKRTIPLDSFFSGPGETILGSNEILTEIHIPTPSPKSGAAYFRHSIRPLMDLAIVNVAASLTLDDERKTFIDSRIVLGSVAPTVIRAKRAEALLHGQAIDNSTLKKAAKLAADESRPISDVRGSDFYRREMVSLFTQRALEKALERALGNPISK